MLDTTPPPLSDLIYLARLYAATSPSTPILIPSPPFPSPIVISTPFVQNWLVDNLLNSSPSGSTNSRNETSQNEEEGNKIWKKIFWRRIVSSIETGFTLRAASSGAAHREVVEDEEIRSEILEEMIRCMSVQVASGPGTSSRRYEWGALEGGREEWKSITVREEGKVISDGTTGLRTWQASLSLSNHLIASNYLNKSTSPILELGSGAGLLSLVCAKLNSRRKIVASDVDYHVLERSSDNITLNGLESQIEVTHLDWEHSLLPNGASLLSEWEQRIFPHERPQLILGADIVYDPTLSEPLIGLLIPFLRPISKPPSALIYPEALLAVTMRVPSTWMRFISLCADAGLLVRELEMLACGRDGIVGAEGWEGEGEVKLVCITQATANS